MKVGTLVQVVDMADCLGVVSERLDNKHGPSYIDDLTGTMVPRLLFKVLLHNGSWIYKAESQLRKIE